MRLKLRLRLITPIRPVRTWLASLRGNALIWSHRTGCVPIGRAFRAAMDPGTDKGLRQALGEIDRTGSWDGPAGQAVLAEIRRRAVRNAAHVAAATGTTTDRGLVDDVVTAAWMVLRRFGGVVRNARSPWAYLMSSAQRMVAEEVRAQQLLTGTARIRGRARHSLPRWVRPIGSTPAELATAFRHEPAGEPADVQAIPQVGIRVEAPLTELLRIPSTPASRWGDSWLTAFVDLLVEHGADPAITTAALDRLADLLHATAPRT